jgi:RyR domain/TrkA-N domain
MMQVFAGAIALALGFWGWNIAKPPASASGVVDNIFRTFQLIALQFPANFNGIPNAPLQIARLALPIVAILASFDVLVGSITRPARLALLPYMTGHIVICGSDALTEAALTNLASRGRQVVVIAPKSSPAHRDMMEGLGLTVVDGDPLQTATIRSLHLSHAATLFVTGDDDVANLNTAMLALPSAGVRPPELPPLILAVLIKRENLAVELDAALDELSRRHRIRYHRLCPAREGIRLELVRFAPVFLKDDLDARSHVLLVGLIENWQQIVAQLVTAMQDHPTQRPLLTFVIDEVEADSVKLWHDGRPELDLVLEIAILKRGAGELLPPEEAISIWCKTHAPPQLAVVLRMDADAVATALALRRTANAFGTAKTPILVHQEKEDRLLSRLGDIDVRNRDLSNLVAVGGLVRVESIERVLDRKGDDMAISLHAHYLADAKRVGAGSSIALQAWDNLPENLRDANRASAEHVPILVAAAGLRIVAADVADGRTVLSPDLFELLARVEHRRWIADRIDRGWHYGAVRDDLLKLHPSLAPYESLSEAEREKDRDTVRTLLNILIEDGHALARYCEPTAAQ